MIFQQPEFWIAVGFVMVIGISLKLHVPKLIAGLLDKRSAAIAKELDDARKLRLEAEKLLASYIAKTAQVDSEAAKILTDAKADAERFAAESRVQMKAQIERRAQMAKEKIAQAEAQALSEIRGLAADAAVAAAGKLILSQIDEARASALIHDSIAGLPGKLN